MLDSLGDGATSPSGGFDNPFAMPSSMPNSMPQNNRNMPSPNIDLDAVIKDIDRKIAELDAEEAKQKAMMNNHNGPSPEIILPKIQDKPIVEEPKVEPIESEPIKSDSYNIYNEAPKNEFHDELSTEPVVEKKEDTIVIPHNQSDLLDNLANENYNIYNQELPKVETVAAEAILPATEPINQEATKPKINVDVDSVIVNDSIVSDDEFFDDFFGE